MLRRASLALSLSLALACSAPPIAIDTGPADGGADVGRDAGPPDWTFETIETRSELVLETPRRVELIRAHRPDGARTYLLYVHARDGAPLVLLNQPYDGIDWTGEDLDRRWAALGDGLHPDVEGPGDPGSDVIAYANKTISSAATDAAIYLLNEISVVHVYARFYAGGSLEDDIVDASAGYYFALSRAGEIDVSRVGSFGGSWGGMMALFGATRAPESVNIRSVVPVSPPSDFVDLYDWISVRGPAVYPSPENFAAFAGPYRRRILAATGAGPRARPDAWTRYRPEAVCAALRAPVLVPHDEWDVLIPFGETLALAAECPEHVSGVYWPRQGTIDYAAVGLDHGLFGREPVYPMAFAFAVLEIVRALRDSPSPALTIAHLGALESYLDLLRIEQIAGGDVGYAIEPLEGLCDPRTRCLDPSDGSIVEGAALLSSALNAVYSTKTTPATACSEIADGLPIP